MHTLTVLLYGALKANNENEISSFCASRRLGGFTPFVLNLSMLSKTDTACQSVLVEMQQVFSGRCYSMALVNKINLKKQLLLFSKNGDLDPFKYTLC
jgi:ABC-type transporter Mla MlaB component